MAHAHHFLSRLDRLSHSDVELALSLYRDAPLVAFVLEAAKVPEAAERVAISLRDQRDGLRRSREMTRVCSREMTHHASGAGRRRPEQRCVTRCAGASVVKK
jgi:hypothetical protein